MLLDLFLIISMSKVAFISDIHGNYPALKAVLHDIDNQRVDRIFCLGDLVGYYSQINEVINTIREREISCIIGNHDYAMIHSKGVIERSKTCTNVLTRQLEYISAENFEFLHSLKDSMSLSIDGYTIFAVHGGLNDYIDEYLPELSLGYFEKLDEHITHVITAHNHIPKVADYGRIHYANSGSVGQPRDYNPKSGYVLFENGIFTIHRVSYDFEDTIQRMKDDGFPDYIAEILSKGCKIGG